MSLADELLADLDEAGEEAQEDLLEVSSGTYKAYTKSWYNGTVASASATKLDLCLLTTERIEPSSTDY